MYKNEKAWKTQKAKKAHLYVIYALFFMVAVQSIIYKANADYEITIKGKPLEIPKEETVKQDVKEERDLADYIWLKESTRGKNNYSKCEAIGKINGIGYGIPGDGTYMCFNSHEEEMVALKGWIVAKKAKGLTELEMLCLYSGGNYKECKK